MESRETGWFSSPMPPGRNADAADGAGVNKALDTGGLRGREHVAGACRHSRRTFRKDVSTKDGNRRRHERRDRIRRRRDREKPGSRRSPGTRSTSRSGTALDGRTKRPHAVSAFEQQSGNVPADESGGAGDKCGFHRPALSPAGGLEFHERGERHQREIEPVVVIVEVEDLGEAGASGQFFAQSPSSCCVSIRYSMPCWTLEL